MTNYSYIKCEFPYKVDHVALIQLNRPKVLNALSTDLMAEVVDALSSYEKDEQVRAVILTGDDRAFAAGADIEELSKASPIDQFKDDRFVTWKKLAMFTKPLIAAVNGFALGGGCELAMSCDFIVASDSAKFGQPEINIGTIPGAGGTQRLTAALGKAKAMMMILTGEMISAHEALAHGLVAKVAPKETLLTETLEIAKKIASQAPIAAKLAKDAVNQSFNMSLKDGLEFERRNFYLTFASEDQKEGMRAFLEKRKPDYKGN